MLLKHQSKPKIVILGGGVAGMSAAHELAERGYKVAVYETKSIPGGKARSIPVPGTGMGGRKPLPGEHGFRFFPKFYKHITDTMKRIPFGSNREGVYNNLVEGTNLGLAFFDKPLLPFLTEFPRSIGDIKVLFKSLFHNNLGLSEKDAEHYVDCLWQVLSSCNERRREDYQRIAWWDFIQADRQSDTFRKIFTGLTRILVAAKAREANAATIGSVGATLMLDMVTPNGSADRLLNGPTNEAWLHPWLNYLVTLGVEFHFDTKVQKIHCGADGTIQGVTVVKDGTTALVQGDEYISCMPVEVMATLVTDELVHADPSLALIKELAQSVEWMNGIQFYLNEEVNVIHGHVICMDSPWALTLVSQKQFWPNYPLEMYGNGDVKAVISVDISDWNTPGLLTGKTAMQCTQEEIKNEVWEQLGRSLNHGGKPLLADHMLVDWFLDEDIQFPNPHEAVNMEPLLVNRVNTWNLRPNAYTAIPNLFLAADYVRTNTDLATMEGANEAARRAVNCILEKTGASEKPCRIWELYNYNVVSAWRVNDRDRYERGLPWNGKVI